MQTRKSFAIPRQLASACALVAAATLAHAQDAQISDDVVRVGVLSDLAGPFADITGPGTVTAVQMAIDDFGGKVAGKKIELVTADHQNKADIAASKARVYPSTSAAPPRPRWPCLKWPSKRTRSSSSTAPASTD